MLSQRAGFPSFLLNDFPLCICMCVYIYMASEVVLVEKNPPANGGDLRNVGSTPGSGRSPGGGH